MSRPAAPPRALVDQSGRVVVERCELAERMGDRMRGLLGRPGLDPGAGLLITKTGNRMTVSREDVADMAPFTLAHRLIVSGVDPAAVVAEAIRGAMDAKPGD